MTIEVDPPAALEQFEDAALLQNEPYDDNDDFDDDDDDDDFDDDFAPSGGGGGGGGGGGNSAAMKKMNFSHSVSNSVSKMQDLEVKKRTLHTSRDDRATSEQCLDPRTRLMLFKMLSNGILDEIDGCLSTGKEANVYYAKAGRKSPSKDVTEFAIKIFKTSILVFKDRDKYVSGEHRWRRGYCKFGFALCDIF
jgi:RIO kinase 1